QVYEGAQSGPCTGEPRLHSADRNVENCRGLLITQAFHCDQHQHLAVILAEAQEGLLNLRQDEVMMLSGLCDERTVVFKPASIGNVVLRAPLVVSEHILKDDKEPGAQIGSGLPGADIGYRTRQALLDEIVRIIGIARHVARKTAQSRYLRSH